MTLWRQRGSYKYLNAVSSTNNTKKNCTLCNLIILACSGDAEAKIVLSARRCLFAFSLPQLHRKQNLSHVGLIDDLCNNPRASKHFVIRSPSVKRLREVLMSNIVSRGRLLRNSSSPPILFIKIAQAIQSSTPGRK